ncbi:MAG: LysE/ArgO family amino acid transporter [Gammaproteobacteria bacterium]|nr:LysE/ArgO family amino acid transporter [Gammaproteobacteria bacterium]
MTGFVSGFALSFGLILAIGAQNAFILKQGLRREYVFILCLICAISDALLIALGVFGFVLMVNILPAVSMIARVAGAIFLLVYGAISFYKAFKNNESLYANGASKTTLVSAVLTCLALTWLNPHVYLDTFVLLGAVSTQYPNEQYQFVLGASMASFIFFFSVGYGARFLAPIFNKPSAWKVLEFIIGGIMWIIAISLIFF